MWFRWSSSVGNPLRSPGGGTKRWAKCAATGIGVALLPFMALTLVTEAPALAGPLPTTLYVYATGVTGAGAPSGCPTEGTPASGCSLGQALTLVNGTTGETIALETPGSSGTYDGNWSLTSTALTIEPASGISNPTLSGLNGLDGYTGAVLSLDHVNLTATALTIEDAHHTAAGPSGPSLGGAIDTYGGTVTISVSTFLDNQAAYGGAINNADGDWGAGTAGTVNVTGSTFTGNIATAGDGGAIDNSGGGGDGGILNVTGSSFQGNHAVAVVNPPPHSAITGNGGAIDNADESGSTGALTVTTSTFLLNVAANGGGAIDNGDNGGNGTAASPGVTLSSFDSNSAGDGGAIDNGDNGGGGTVTVGSSTFGTNTATFDGGAIDNGDNGGNSHVTVSGSMFDGNSVNASASNGDGGAIDNGDDGGTGTLSVTASTFYNNSAVFPVYGSHGGAIDNADDGGTGTLTATASTFDLNSATVGTVIDNDDYTGIGAVHVAADIFTSSCQETGEGTSTWTDGGYNVGPDATCETGTTGDNHSASNLATVLGAGLANNGGPTDTIAITTTGSDPAYRIIPSGTSTLCPTTDQRGYTSAANTACDAGAYQSSGTTTGQTITFTSSPPSPAYVGGSYTPTATAPGGTVTFSLGSGGTAGACTYNAGTFTFASDGTCDVAANQSGGNGYPAAPQNDQTFSITTASTGGGGGGGGGVAVTPTLTVTGPNDTIYVGSAIPTLTPTYTGGTPTTAATCTTTATSASAPGVYPVTCTGAVESGFQITYVPGTLTIVTTTPVTTPPPVPTPTLSFYHAAGSRLASNPAGTGWWVLETSGNVKAYGTAKAYGGYTAGKGKNVPVAIASTADGKGYWLVAANGTVHTFGDANGYGPTSKLTLAKPIVGIASTPDGKGYLLVSANGSVYNYGDAHFYGPTSKLTLAKPIVGIASTPDGKGYWLVSAGGSVYNYGDALFYGPTSKLKVATPIVGITSTPDGKGYWLVAAGGGVFNYGDAHPYGSDGGKKVTKAIVGLIASATGTSYDLVNSVGAATHFPS